MKYSNVLLSVLLLSATNGSAQTSPQPEIPSILHGLSYNASGLLNVTADSKIYTDNQKKDAFVLSNFTGNAKGTATGLAIDIQKPGFSGSVTYGPLRETDKFPTVAFQGTVEMTDGKALLEIKDLFVRGEDYYRLQDRKQAVMGYRVMTAAGKTIYEGRIAYQGNGPYEVVPTIIEGPMINELSPEGCVISFETQLPVKAIITVAGKAFSDESAGTHHEIKVSSLQSATDYPYSIQYADRTDKHTFKTAPKAGSRQEFTFAFAGANRAATGGGEREFGGVNYQTSRAIMALATQHKAAFVTVVGDFTSGGNTTTDGHLLEFNNYKRAFEPFWSAIPIYTTCGDHEPNKRVMTNPGGGKGKAIDQFPYNMQSGEAAFAKAFVHPTNGPQSEDGASYDPNPSKSDFPTYQENVYSYTYDNVGFIVLNPEYWLSKDPTATGGNSEGYVMDKQIQWLQETMAAMEKNTAIDHVFVFAHDAVFPNGDHLEDAMWWSGKNTARAWVAGKGLSKGIIERRDEILDICVNKSKKFLGFISGDEHNFSFLPVTPDMPHYTPDYTGPKLALSRPFYCINNGAGGSTAYGALKSPWSDRFKYFTGPSVASFITVNGKSVTLNALDAETLDPVCTDVILR